ncbi:DUF4124 domain-containing protein [Pseudomaricurvus alcaniphilus]|uniref:DUF4124 domain-containing protein n=1 Tax=Pseudomaricurvus alcaniphilus TaxID=1166482 RepID=UPI00140968AF|nr:DUF4124 domain-containing protein [Pseudomaricurvus alcaniphilus]NHN38671.1 DUF4124 domain-containing protein [Pseudomaricurvus alcaniphilus]
MRLPLLPLLLTLCIGLPASAAIYKEVDQDGKVTYSDKPTSKQVERLDLPRINTQPAPPVMPRQSAPVKPAQGAALRYQISIDSPLSGAHIPPGQRQLEVVVQLQPELQSGHRLQAYINGTAMGPALAETRLLLQELYRGEHQLSVAVIDQADNQVTTSPAVTIYVHRPRVARPKPKAAN